jgi:hypothetical protein
VLVAEQHRTGNDRSLISSQAVAEAKPAHKDTIRSVTWPGLSAVAHGRKERYRNAPKSRWRPISNGSGTWAAPIRHRIRWHESLPQRGAVMLGDEMIDEASRKMALVIAQQGRLAGMQRLDVWTPPSGLDTDRTVSTSAAR